PAYQRAAAGGGLLPGAYRVDLDSGAGADAGDHKGGHRPRALRRGHDPQSDDRAAAPAAWHGAVRAGSHLQAVDRAHDDSHPAVANPTVGVAVGHLPRPRAYPVAAARHRAHPVAAGAGAGALLHPRRYGLWAKRWLGAWSSSAQLRGLVRGLTL